MDKICEHCGKTFDALRANHRFCCPECAQRHWYEHNYKPPVRKPRKCEHCGKEFTPKYYWGKYCSPDCYTDARRQQTKKRREEQKQPLKHNSQLDEWIAAANAAGLSYGKYRAAVEQLGKTGSD